jgi:creatinase
MTDRPEFFAFPNGAKAPLPFAAAEYDARLAGLRRILAEQDLDAAVLTSMHGIAYYSGFLYCSFGRPYACVVTADAVTTVAANIDGGQPWRRCHGAALTHTDWQRDNYWRAVRSLTGEGKRLGIEADHLTLQSRAALDAFLAPAQVADIAPAAMRQGW